MASVKGLAPSISRTTLRPVKYGGMEGGGRLFAALMIFPTVLVVLAITAFPFFYSAWLSVNELNQFTKRWIFVGLDNYALTWQSGDLRDAFGRTLIFCVITVIGGTLLGLRSEE